MKRSTTVLARRARVDAGGERGPLGPGGAQAGVGGRGGRARPRSDARLPSDLWRQGKGKGPGVGTAPREWVPGPGPRRTRAVRPRAPAATSRRVYAGRERRRRQAPPPAVYWRLARKGPRRGVSDASGSAPAPSPPLRGRDGGAGRRPGPPPKSHGGKMSTPLTPGLSPSLTEFQCVDLSPSWTRCRVDRSVVEYEVPLTLLKT